MKPSLMLGFVLVFGLVASASSCADSSDDANVNHDAGPTVVPPPVEAGADATADAGCDGGGLGCAPPPMSCENADWCPVTVPLDGRLGLAAIWGTSKTDVWAVGSGGTILHFDGAAWMATPSETTEAIYAIWGSGPRDLWAVSSTQQILRGTGYQNGTAVWQRTTPLAGPTDYDAVGKLVRAVWGTSATDVMLGSESFARSFSDPPANRWRADLSGGDVTWSAASDCVRSFNVKCPSIFGLWGTGANDRWAVGTSGTTAHATATADDGSPLWTPLDSQSTTDLQAVWGSGPGDVWTVGERGTIRRFTTGMERLAIIDAPTNEDLRGVWGSAANDVWAVGDRGTVLHFDGTAWKPASVALPPGDRPNLRGVWGSSAEDVWAVGDGIVLHFTGKKAAR